MFKELITNYEVLRKDYQELVVGKMSKQDYVEYNEILFSTHSCALEGNSFSVDDTRQLKEKGLGMIPYKKTLFEAFEVLDHLLGFEYVINNLDKEFDETLLREINRLVTLHTLSYKYPGSTPGEYTDVDMAAGDTVFGDHVKLIAKVPVLLSSTQNTLKEDNIHPMIIAARFHGFYEYLHPFRDGNGRTGRLLSNFILLKKKHPLLIIRLEDRKEYINALRNIKKEHTDEYLIRFFFKTAIQHMEREIDEKRQNSNRLSFVF